MQDTGGGGGGQERGRHRTGDGGGWGGRVGRGGREDWGSFSLMQSR